MTTAKLNLLEFMKTTRLSVPIYQRPYSWEEKHCKKLLEDIKQAGQPERETPHFMGSVLSVTKNLAAGEKPTDTPYTLIDGQQRITTLSLLLIALRDRLGNTPPPPRSLLMQTATSPLKSKAKTNTN